MSSPKITIVDYGMGNIWSVSSALNFLNIKNKVTSDPHEILQSECLILPGVGSFREAMEMINNNGIDQALNDSINKGTKILGICLGMQLLGSSSEEDGLTSGLNFFDRKVEPFSFQDLPNIKLPHIGFNSVSADEKSNLFKNINTESDFYFVHSYRMESDNTDQGHGTCFYGEEFLASFECDNVFGTQFHPEKSQTNGIKLLKNFLEI